MSFLNAVQSEYERAVTSSPGGADLAARERAWAVFNKMGLPTRKTEAWRYSTLAGLTRSAWASPPAGRGMIPAAATALREIWRDRFDVLMVVNGEARLSESVLSPEWSALIGSAALADTEDGHPASFEDGFAGLATAISRPGVDLMVPAGHRSRRPLLLIRAQHGEGAWAATNNRIRLGADAEVDLGEIFLSETGRGLRTDLTRVTLAPGSRLNWLRMQEDGADFSHFAEVSAELADSSGLFLHQLNRGGAWMRGTLRADIRGEGAEAQVSGLTFGHSSQHIEQRVIANHLAPRTTSTQLFKAVLKDRARGVLNGKIFIAQDAQKVSSSQLNHNLLLSPGAEADTKPELEIYADDVKANHGASVGRLDEGKMFYLMSRGIRRDLAQQMLARAFVGDVLMKIGAPVLRDLAETRVAGWLPDFAAGMRT